MNFSEITQNLNLSKTDQYPIASTMINILFDNKTKIDYPYQNTIFNKIPCAIFISIASPNKSAITIKLIGKHLNEAVDNLKIFHGGKYKNRNELCWIKFYFIKNVTNFGKISLLNPLPIDRYNQGMILCDDIKFSFLPQQIVSLNILNRENNIPRSILKKISNSYTLDHTTFSTFETDNIFLRRIDEQWKPLAPSSTMPLSKYNIKRAIRSSSTYLKRKIRSNGKFIYCYLPKQEIVPKKYNILRHIGTIYSLLEYYQYTSDHNLLNKISLAINFLIKHVKPIKISNKDYYCIVEKNRVKLGGNALAILMFLKYTEVTHDTRYNYLFNGLAEWLLLFQNSSGEFTPHKISFPDLKPQPFVSEYYPGEAIFALTQLNHFDKDEKWLDHAEHATLFLINHRYRTQQSTPIIQDHWLLYGLNNLYRKRPKKIYIEKAFYIADSILQSQHKGQVVPAHWHGGFYNPPCSTPTAIRAEGLICAYKLARDYCYKKKASQFLQAIKYCLMFQMRTQFSPETALYLSNPKKAIGGFHHGLTSYEIRIDYVQHNLSALLGYINLQYT